MSEFFLTFPGSYTCVASTRTTGTATDTGFLRVEGIPPELVTAPSDKNEVEGKTITILCKVKSNPPSSQTWEKVFIISEPDLLMVLFL